jgi:hypothetical protein
MASGNTLLEFSPAAMTPTAVPPQIDWRNLHPIVCFDAALDEGAFWSAVLPQAYAGGGLTAYIHWAAASATSGDVVFGVSIERIGEGVLDIDGDSFATELTVTATAPGTTGHLDIASRAFTSGAAMDSLVAGEGFRVKIRRLGSTDANDTMAGDAQVWGVELRES